jgi:tellurite resistance protein TehA-like permease
MAEQREAVVAIRWSGLAPDVFSRVMATGASASWLLLVPVAAVRIRARPLTELRDQARGTWLLPSVATQGLSITAADLAAQGGPAWLLGIASAAWLAGVLLYPPTLWLIGSRVHASSPPRPDLVTPDSWILMGALAIAVLAGGNLVRTARLAHLPDGVLWWTAQLTALAPWTAASLWVPVLVYARVWRANQLSGSLRYHGGWWSAVFPIGMYSSATSATGSELAIPALHTVSLVVFWIAFAVWTMVALGSLRTSVRRWARRDAA